MAATQSPVTAGRKRNVLMAILNPERTKSWEGVRPALEQLDDLIRRYEARKNEAGTREVLSDDIKCTAVELLVLQDLEKHLILNKSRLTKTTKISSKKSKPLWKQFWVRKERSTGQGQLPPHRHKDLPQWMWMLLPSCWDP